MKIVFLVYKNQSVGMGHFYRSITLANACKRRGHDVIIFGNVMFTDYSQVFFQLREDNYDDLYHGLQNIHPDWLVVDLQSPPKDHIKELCNKFGTKILLMNGVGRDWDSDWADITVSQGYSDNTEYSGVDYVVIRPEIYKIAQELPRGDQWFVFGGSADKMGLLQKFHDNVPDPARLIVTKFTPEIVPNSNMKDHFVAFVDGSHIFPFMAMSGKACVASGMTAFELSVMGIPIYLFSQSEGHLEFARDFEQSGLGLAYPEVGLPENKKFGEFLQQSFVPSGKIPDGKACDRIIGLMENYV